MLYHIYCICNMQWSNFQNPKAVWWFPELNGKKSQMFWTTLYGAWSKRWLKLWLKWTGLPTEIETLWSWCVTEDAPSCRWFHRMHRPACDRSSYQGQGRSWRDTRTTASEKKNNHKWDLINVSLVSHRQKRG